MNWKNSKTTEEFIKIDDNTCAYFSWFKIKYNFIFSTHIERAAHKVEGKSIVNNVFQSIVLHCIKSHSTVGGKRYKCREGCIKKQKWFAHVRVRAENSTFLMHAGQLKVSCVRVFIQFPVCDLNGVDGMMRARDFPLSRVKFDFALFVLPDKTSLTHISSGSKGTSAHEWSKKLILRFSSEEWRSDWWWSRNGKLKRRKGEGVVCLPKVSSWKCVLLLLLGDRSSGRYSLNEKLLK